MFAKCIKSIFLFLLSSICWAGVASNPFLRPGSNRPPPEQPPAPPPPKPKIDPSFSKEVEFRGYFLLKGIPHFCIFNKKSNFGEWIKLTEKTVEDFEAQAFDLESETLTLAFSGQTFDLILANPAPSSALPSSGKSSNNSGQNLGSSNPISNTKPKIMPPKPDRVPQLPSWLTSRMGNSLSPGSQNQSDVTSRKNSSNQRSIPPRLPSFTSNTNAPSNLNTGISSGLNQSPSTVNQPGNLAGNNPPSFQDDLTTTQNEISTFDSDQIDLEGLPPPPPPPNILPPTGPPNLIPSRDD